MKTVVVTPKSTSEYKFLSDLLHKLGIASRDLSTEEMEDIGLSKMMKQVDRTKKVSRSLIMKKLAA